MGFVWAWDRITFNDQPSEQLIVTIRADFQQGMELVSYFKMNTMTEQLLAHLCSSKGNMTFSCGVLFSVTELI